MRYMRTSATHAQNNDSGDKKQQTDNLGPLSLSGYTTAVILYTTRSTPHSPPREKKEASAWRQRIAAQHRHPNTGIPTPKRTKESFEEQQSQPSILGRYVGKTSIFNLRDRPDRTDNKKITRPFKSIPISVSIFISFFLSYTNQITHVN